MDVVPIVSTVVSARPAGRSGVTCCITVLAVQQLVPQRRSVLRLCHCSKEHFHSSTGPPDLHCVVWIEHWARP